MDYGSRTEGARMVLATAFICECILYVYRGDRLLNMEEVQSTHVYHWTGEDAGSCPAHLGNLMDIVSLMNSKDT